MNTKVNRGPAPPYYKLRIHTYSTQATLLPKCFYTNPTASLGSLASLGNLMRLVVFLYEGGKSIPALPLRLTTVKPEQVVTAIPVIGMSNFLRSVIIRDNQE